MLFIPASQRVSRLLGIALCQLLAIAALCQTRAAGVPSISTAEERQAVSRGALPIEFVSSPASIDMSDGAAIDASVTSDPAPASSIDPRPKQPEASGRPAPAAIPATAPVRARVPPPSLPAALPDPLLIGVPVEDTIDDALRSPLPPRTHAIQPITHLRRQTRYIAAKRRARPTAVTHRSAHKTMSKAAKPKAIGASELFP